MRGVQRCALQGDAIKRHGGRGAWCASVPELLRWRDERGADFASPSGRYTVGMGSYFSVAPDRCLHDDAKTNRIVTYTVERLAQNEKLDNFAARGFALSFLEQKDHRHTSCLTAIAISMSRL